MITIKNFYVDTTKKVDVVPVGHEVRALIREAKAEKGWVILQAPTSGASFLSLENQEKKVEGLKKALEGFSIKDLFSCFLPGSFCLLVEKGKLTIDPWQEVFLVDYEVSGRRREYSIQVYSEAVTEGNEPQ